MVLLSEYDEYAEEKAAELIARRNAIVKAGADPDTRYVNKIEERASNWLTRAKHG